MNTLVVNPGQMQNGCVLKLKRGMETQRLLSDIEEA